MPRGADGGVWRYTTSGNSNEINRWVPLGGTITGDVGVTSIAGEIQIVVRGANNQLYTNRTVNNYLGSAWTGFSAFGGTASGNPGAFFESRPGTAGADQALVRDGSGNLAQYISTLQGGFTFTGPTVIPGATLS